MSTFSAPAKIILIGEHAVVYGQPAVAIPLPNLRAVARLSVDVPAGQGLRLIAEDTQQNIQLRTVQADDPLTAMLSTILERLGAPPPDATITLHSSIPIASGLGSGAAIAAVLARALSTATHIPLTDAELNDLVYEVEKIHHGTPSGIDNTVVVYERPVYYVRGQPLEWMATGGLFHLIVADTGKPASTKIAVGDVRRLYESQPDQIRPVIEAIGQLVQQARQEIAQGNTAALGTLMNENQALLHRLTVSSPELDQLIQAARSAGALGAKLSGGGRGGNMIALVTPDTAGAVEQALRDSGAARVFRTALQPEAS